MNVSILVVDDEPAFTDSVVTHLRNQGYRDVVGCTSAREATALIEQRSFDVALLDVRMPHTDGLALLERVKSQSQDTICVMMSGNDSLPVVIRAVKLGAYDYLVKPIEPDSLHHVLSRAMEVHSLRRFVARGQEARAGRAGGSAFSELITADPGMIGLLDEAELHAASDIPVLITGETGVGKELLARAIHRTSRRRGGPFVAINMLSLSATLFEPELFGHARGAFTGADRDRTGYLAQAASGTLFLDEIGDLTPEVQGKLLRVLQENEYVPLGKTRAVHADVRFVAATNVDLEAQMLAGRFRRDLYYRLRFAHLEMPPLRERRDDVLLLAGVFIQARAGASASLTPAAVARLLRHDWPGNVRELKGVIEAAVNRAAGAAEIDVQHLGLPAPRKDSSAPAASQGDIEPLAEVERRHILAVYERCDRNKTHTARALGIGPATLHRKLKAYGVP
jgi:DNA-binding NtrC family response regulator